MLSISPPRGGPSGPGRKARALERAPEMGDGEDGLKGPFLCDISEVDEIFLPGSLGKNDIMQIKIVVYLCLSQVHAL